MRSDICHLYGVAFYLIGMKNRIITLLTFLELEIKTLL